MYPGSGKGMCGFPPSVTLVEHSSPSGGPVSSATGSPLQVPINVILESQHGGKAFPLWGLVRNWQMTRPTVCNIRASPGSRSRGPWYIEITLLGCTDEDEKLGYPVTV